MKKLTEGSLYLCVGPEWAIDVSGVPGVEVETFSGPHPAGLPGTHIHTLAPVSRERHAFHLGVQDAIAIGELVSTGILNPARVISLAGPIVKTPRLVQARLGASISEITSNEVQEGPEARVVSGSILFGHQVTGTRLISLIVTIGKSGLAKTESVCSWDGLDQVFPVLHDRAFASKWFRLGIHDEYQRLSPCDGTDWDV